MAKYLIKATYTVEGTRGLVKDGGGTARRAAVQQMLQGLNGKVEAYYSAFGEADPYAIVDAPDNVTVAAVSLAVNASGGVTTKTVVLLTPEEIDQVAKKTATYRAPGSSHRVSTRDATGHPTAIGCPVAPRLIRRVSRVHR